MKILSDFKATAQSLLQRATLKYIEGIQTTTLPNGIEVVTHHIPSIFHPLEQRQIEYSAVIQGGRFHEIGQKIHGIFHFYEHMVTEKSLNFAGLDEGLGYIPGVGGDFGAVTGPRSNSYSITTHPKNKKTALYALADKIGRPILDSNSFKKNQALIEAERIDSEMDHEEKFEHLYLSALFGGSPTEYNILGTRDSIQKISLDDLIKHGATHIRSGQIVIAAEGPIRHRKVVGMVAEHFKDIPSGGRLPEVTIPYVGGYAKKHTPNIEGVKIRLGFNCGTDSEVEANHIFSMSFDLRTTLNETLRNQGLLYNLKTSNDKIANLNIFSIEFAASPEKVDKILSIIRDTLHKEMNPVEEVKHKPSIRDWFSEPVRCAKDIRPYYSHSFSDYLLHPWQTLQQLIQSRSNRRGAKNLAYDLMTKGVVPSSNEAFHAFLSTTPKDKVAIVQKMCEQSVAYCVEGNLNGIPDYARVHDMFLIKPSERKTVAIVSTASCSASKSPSPNSA